MPGCTVTVRPIAAADAVAVGDFLHRRLNPRVAPEAWARLIQTPWPDDGVPNHGFVLLDGDEVVGAYVAVHSTRPATDGPVHVCNLAAFCVDEDYRRHSLRLIRAVLGQPGMEFTDLSPSGSVVALNERLGFRHLDTATRLVPNLPWPRGHRVRVTDDPRGIAQTLTGPDLAVYRDHVDAPAARHLVVRCGAGSAYLMFRRSTRRHLPLFASPLYVGADRDLLREAWPHVASHLLTRHGLPFTLAEERVLGFAPRLGVELSAPRPKMVKGLRLTPREVDYLYSELTLVEW